MQQERVPTHSRRGTHAGAHPLRRPSSRKTPHKPTNPKNLAYIAFKSPRRHFTKQRTNRKRRRVDSYNQQRNIYYRLTSDHSDQAEVHRSDPSGNSHQRATHLFGLLQ
ncbi:Hypothetical predicted protein [Pelobates cultripes]|uniref:Uncharacterized protein n=1 Tax=Pelobates cultripes TaxID=61616 RepID=A0AAD1VYJ7_PELCU|nr:Hypothetical predicted protein [Pelobates cultripes]